MGAKSKAGSAAEAASNAASSGLDSTTLITILVVLGVLLLVAIFLSALKKSQKKKVAEWSENSYRTPARLESSYMTEVIRNGRQTNPGEENSAEEPPHRPLVGDSRLWLSPGRYERLSPPSPAMTPRGSPGYEPHISPGWRSLESQGRVVAVNSDNVGLLSERERANGS